MSSIDLTSFVFWDKLWLPSIYQQCISLRISLYLCQLFCLLSLPIAMLGEGVVDVAVLHEAAKLVIGRPGARAVQTSAGSNCGGEQCPDLFETRLCHGSKPVSCHLSYWSEWSACTTVCGVSGKQTIYCHRIRTEQCGGVCTSTFYKTRACPLTSCLNGGGLRGETCFCKKGFGGNCCEKEGNIYRLATVKCLLASLWSSGKKYVLLYS